MAISKKYQAYLNSPEWKFRRLKRLHCDKFTCQKCKKNTATQVHHKTYKRIYKEQMRDLMSVCSSCHRKIHGLDREGKKRSIIGRVLARVIG